MDFQLLTARLLFPSNFFDQIDLLNNNEITNENILKIYDYTENYEHFLKKALYLINKKINLPIIDWLK